MMSIDATSPLIPDEMPPLPDGVEIVVRRRRRTGAPSTSSTASPLAGALGLGRLPYDDWIEHDGCAVVRPCRLVAAHRRRRTAGICLLSNSRTELDEGTSESSVFWGSSAVAAAQLLLRRAFVHYRAQGRRRSPSVSTPRTRQVPWRYEKVGMSPALVFEVYEHDLA